jgi:mono/diheme cytochrome c family protein
MGGMMERHRAPAPEEYAGLTNPVPADEESLARGEEIYGRLCASCHGDGGMGDGPAAENLDPAPAPIAHTSRMLGDDYLFWRVTEGGHDFETAMPAWDQALTEQERWDVINYVRALGRGTAPPGGVRGGARFDPALEEEQRAEMLAGAVEQEVITQAEADTFDAVHAAMNEWMAANADTMRGGMGRMQGEILDDLVASGQITEAQAGTFNDVHDRLLAAGLMR